VTPSDSCTIIVSNDTGAVSYDFTLRGDPVPQRFDVTTSITVSDGIPRTGAGNIEQAGSIDLCDMTDGDACVQLTSGDDPIWIPSWATLAIKGRDGELTITAPL
jgi:hypothetical protein